MPLAAEGCQAKRQGRHQRTAKDCHGYVKHNAFGQQTSKARLAQSAERKALNLVVVGSSPTVGVFRRTRRNPGQQDTQESSKPNKRSDPSW